MFLLIFQAIDTFSYQDTSLDRLPSARNFLYTRRHVKECFYLYTWFKVPACFVYMVPEQDVSLYIVPDERMFPHIYIMLLDARIRAVHSNFRMGGQDLHRSQ